MRRGGHDRPLIDLVGPDLAGALMWVEEYDLGRATVQVYKHAGTRRTLHVAGDGRVFDYSGEEIDPEDAVEDVFGEWREAA